MLATKARYNVQKTPAFRERQHIGARIANQLPKLMTARECAKRLGISTQRLRLLECEALWKVQARLIEYLREHDITL